MQQIVPHPKNKEKGACIIQNSVFEIGRFADS